MFQIFMANNVPDFLDPAMMQIFLAQVVQIFSAQQWSRYFMAQITMVQYWSRLSWLNSGPDFLA